jgi:hypothetical protein
MGAAWSLDRTPRRGLPVGSAQRRGVPEGGLRDTDVEQRAPEKALQYMPAAVPWARPALRVPLMACPTSASGVPVDGVVTARSRRCWCGHLDGGMPRAVQCGTSKRVATATTDRSTRLAVRPPRGSTRVMTRTLLHGDRSGSHATDRHPTWGALDQCTGGTTRPQLQAEATRPSPLQVASLDRGEHQCTVSGRPASLLAQR